MAEITPDEFKLFLHGYNITDCVVREHDLFYFIADEDYTKWPTSQWDPENDSPPSEYEVKKIFVGYDGAAPFGGRVGKLILTGYDITMAGASTRPDAKGFAISMEGDIYAAGGGLKEGESNIPTFENGGPLRGVLMRLRTIDGWLYLCGGRNSVGKRLGKNSWFSHTQDVPNPPRKDSLYNMLYDIDGFSENDLYTVGNDGQVFHFDGASWKRIGVPTNIKLETVCCAGDGQVYISGAKGAIFRGRGNKWELMYKGGGSLPFRDMVWYEDRVWCTSDYGLWQIKDGQLDSAALPRAMQACAGSLSTAAGVLLVAGFGGAAYLKNGVWTRIFSAAEMNRSVA